MEFRILGSLEAEAAAGGRLALGGPGEQSVLAVLLLSAGQVVPVADLVDARWEHRPPATAVKQARNAVGRLRHLLASGGEPDVIATERGGYRMCMDGHGLDAWAFEAKAGQAEAAAAAGNVAGAAALLRCALDLWRGPALAGLPGLVLEAAADAWNERRWAAQEAYYGHRLALGEHLQIIGDLRALVSAHRLREGPAAQLMVALYRCGRRAEALDVYQRVRMTLAEELGLDPGPQLQRLHQQILVGDPGPDLPAPGHAQAVTADDVQAGPTGKGVPRGRVDPGQRNSLTGEATTKVWPDPLRIVLAQVEEALCLRHREDHGPSLVVNVTGPLGVGKSALLAACERTRQPWSAGEPHVPDHEVPIIGLDQTGAEQLRQALVTVPGRVLALDNVDGPAAPALLELLGSLPRDRPAPVIVAVSRRALRSLPGWTRAARLVTIAVRPWPDTAIDTLATRLGVHHPQQRELVVRLSAGIPLVTDCLCRSLHAQPAAPIPAAMADVTVREILARLQREDPQQRATAALSALASAGHADEELLHQLTGTPGAQTFTALSALSIVAPAAGGLTVAAPYRTLFELACQWRQPIAHRTTLTRAAVHTRRLMAAAPDQAALGGLVRHQLFLTGDPLIREELFPVPASLVRVRPMAAGEEETAARLVHDWASQRNLSRRNCSRMLESWLTEAAEGFHFACTPDGVPTGLINTIPVGARTASTLEPLLQLHTGQLTHPPDSDPDPHAGVFAGFLICDERDPAARAALLHHTLAASIRHGRLLVATPWPDIEALIRRLGFTHHGQTRHDVYACGRQGQIFTQHFARDDLPRWLDGLMRPACPPRWSASSIGCGPRCARRLSSWPTRLPWPAARCWPCRGSPPWRACVSSWPTSSTPWPDPPRPCRPRPASSSGTATCDGEQAMTPSRAACTSAAPPTSAAWNTVSTRSPASSSSRPNLPGRRRRPVHARPARATFETDLRPPAVRGVIPPSGWAGPRWNPMPFPAVTRLPRPPGDASMTNPCAPAGEFRKSPMPSARARTAITTGRYLS